MKNSKMHGTLTSAIEVSNISIHGIWLIQNDTEYFMPYTEFPWFKDAPVKSIFNIQQLSENHLYWPELDIDLCLDSIKNPERFPLICKETKLKKAS